MKATETQVLHDCENLTATELREKYLSEYNAWANMKKKMKKQGISVHPDFDKFADFLNAVGSKPYPSASLDRINNEDPEYAPEKVRWASKTTQTRNRSNTAKVEHNGKEYPVAEIAERYNIPISTVRARRKAGWSFIEIIHGRTRKHSRKNAKRKARHHSVMTQEERWPWLGPKSSLEWEEDYCEDQPSASRFEYFENTVRPELEELENKIDILRSPSIANEAGALTDEEYDDLLEHFPNVTLASLSFRHLKKLGIGRKRKRDVLEKLEKYRALAGHFHCRPDWETDTE